MLEHPIHADFALIKARPRRPLGQPRLPQDGAQLRSDHGQSAAKCTIAQVREIVTISATSIPRRSSRPGIFVQRVVKLPAGTLAEPQAAAWYGRRMKEPTMKRFTRDQMAARVARDIPEGAYVNLGIGLPTMVANHLPKDREIILHSENGLLGMGPAPAPGDEDSDLINAGKQPVTLLPGGAYFHHADSFAMMRGGHLDFCVLGAFQVSVDGRPRELAHRRARRDSRRRRRDGPRDRREAAST